MGKNRLSEKRTWNGRITAACIVLLIFACVCCNSIAFAGVAATVTEDVTATGTEDVAVTAASTESAESAATTAGLAGLTGISVTYGILSVAALLLAIGYFWLVPHKEIRVMILYIAVFVINTGYFTLSISTTLAEALLANRLAYLGSVVLPLVMLLSIMDLCGMKCRGAVFAILVGISAAIFLLAASGGYCSLYYEEVSLTFVNGIAKLQKVYGPLHFLYRIYLLAYFGSMIGVLLYAMRKKRRRAQPYALFLLIIVLMNLAVWMVEQFLDEDFEFLAVSYVATEMLILLMYTMLPKIDSPGSHASAESVAEETMEEKEDDIDTPAALDRILGSWPETETLTAREREVLKLLLGYQKQKEIAEQLCVTEGTVKKHVTHIYEKLGVRDRSELYIRAFGNPEHRKQN